MTAFDRWTGRESRLLRQALRMSVRGFAQYLGVPVRTVSKWEQHRTARTPRPEFQAVLDTVLARASGEQRARFESALANEGGEDATNRRQFLIVSATVPVTVSTGAESAISAASGESAAWAGTSTPATWARPLHEAVLDSSAVMRQAAAQLPDQDCTGRYDSEAARLIAASLAFDHSALIRNLPKAIGRVELHALTGSDADCEGVFQAVSDVQATAAWTLIKADDCLGASVAAHRALTAAQEANDPLRRAAATRCLAEVHMRAGALGDAGRVAFAAAVELDAAPSGGDTSSPIWCLRGAAFLSAAAAAARRDDERESRMAMEAASRCAELSAATAPTLAPSSARPMWPSTG